MPLPRTIFVPNGQSDPTLLFNVTVPATWLNDETVVLAAMQVVPTALVTCHPAAMKLGNELAAKVSTLDGLSALVTIGI